MCTTLFFFGIPSLVYKSSEKRMRNFLWEGINGGKGSYLVYEVAVGRLVRQGNRALLANWSWCFTLELEALWCKIIVNKHGNLPFE